MEEKEMEVISPTGSPNVGKMFVAPHLNTLKGKTVCEIWNGAFEGDFMFPIYRELLKERYPGVKIIPYNEFPFSHVGGNPGHQREVSKQIAALAKEKNCDAIISGNGG
jgi:hypothetical protein